MRIVEVTKLKIVSMAIIILVNWGKVISAMIYSMVKYVSMTEELQGVYEKRSTTFDQLKFNAAVL